jgi:hypothetical protein
MVIVANFSETGVPILENLGYWLFLSSKCVAI